jgi:type II secretory pathway pseudopilin PulG
MIKTRLQAGDTIIEVLIVIMVLGSVLGGAFITMNRSTTNIRQSQERVEALKVAEGQVESLKSVVKSGNIAVFTAPAPFCLSGTLVVAALTGSFPTLNTDPLTTYVASCKDSGSGGRYNIAIEPNTPDTNTFLVHVRWFKYNAAGNEEVTLAYKVYP